MQKNHSKIRTHFRKHSPRSIQKAKKIFAFKYPKLLLLILSVIMAYYIFTLPGTQDLILELERYSYLGIFVAGIFISFGFSAPFSAGFFLISNPENILLATIVGGLGAMAGDMLIFKTIKVSFMKEFKELEKKNVIRKVEEIVKKDVSLKIKHYLIYIFAGILIMIPGLPDEVAVSMLAGLTTIKARVLAILAFILHSIAIFLILFFGKIF